MHIVYLRLLFPPHNPFREIPRFHGLLQVSLRFLPIPINKSPSFSSGIEVKLPDKVIRRFHTALDILKLEENDRKNVKAFTVFGQDLFHAGTTKSKFGALIGIPSNYSYDNIAQIEKSDIKLKTEDIRWGSREGELLQKALVLTEDEQVFGIAREIIMTNNLQPALNTVYPTATTFFLYSLGKYFNQKLALINRPFSVSWRSVSHSYKKYLI